jgi:uridine phosphorylase
MESFINLKNFTVPRYAFVPGDHDRSKKIADHFDTSSLIASGKGFSVYSGYVDGIPMLAVPTGMGGPTTAVCIEELGRQGVDTFIRIGSCGTAHPKVEVGDVLIATGSYRGTGTSIAYLPIEFPAVADYSVTSALVTSACSLGAKHHVGLGSGEDAFYRKDPAFRERLAGAGVLCADMESDTLFVVATVRHWRAGALFASDGTAKERKPAWGEQAFRIGEELAIQVAIQAMKQIALMDQGKAVMH